MRDTQDIRGQPEGQVSSEVEESPERPVDVVSADLGRGGEASGVAGEAQPVMKHQRHPGRLGTLGPGQETQGTQGEASAGPPKEADSLTHLSLWKSA